MINLSKRITTLEVQRTRLGSEVVVAGFVEQTKLLGKMAFLKLRDREGYVQIVATSNYSRIKDLNTISRESVISIRGRVKKSKARSGGKELELIELNLLSRAATPLPIEFLGKKIETDLSKRLDYRYIDLRNPKILAIFKIRSIILNAIHSFFRENDFLEMQTSKLSGAGAEGGAELFELPYFGKKVALNQSQQLYKQLIMLSGFEKAYEIGTSYRAEKSHTHRHLTEFWQLDVEMSYINGIEDIMKVQERLLVYILRQVKKDGQRELKLLGKELVIPRLPFPRINYIDACKLLKVKPTTDIGTELERKLAKIIKSKFKTDSFFLTNFPDDFTKFYAMHDGKIGRYVDLIYNNNEISSGGQREHRYDLLIQQIKDKKLKPTEFEFYTTPFKYGAPPHGGFGMGIDRLVTFILDLPNIREAVLFPRDVDRIGP
jgi:aspartyl-tRNA synthetase